MVTYVKVNGIFTGEYSNPRSPSVAEQTSVAYSSGVHGIRQGSVTTARCIVCGATTPSVSATFRKAHKHS